MFTLTERKIREEIIVKIPGKKAEYVAQALDLIERKYKKIFYTKFKTITSDIGVISIPFGMNRLINLFAFSLLPRSPERYGCA